MPKSIVATNLIVEHLSVELDETGAVNGLAATINVAYGDTRMREQFDLWATLTPGQRAAFQDVYDTLVQESQAAYLA